MRRLLEIENINLLIFLFSLIAISFALTLQYFFGMLPCKLCNLQRIPYYVIIFTYIFQFIFKNNIKLVTFIILISLLFEFGFSSYHSLVSLNFIEYGGCSSSVKLPLDKESLKNALEGNYLVVDCGNANKKIFGINLSSYNAFTSLIFMLMILSNALKKK